MTPSSAMRSPCGLPVAGLRRGLLALLAAGLAACASPPVMRSEVVRFHAWQPAEPMSFSIRTAAPAIGTLEHRSYEGLLRDRLLALGFVEAPAAAARFQVEFAYAASTEVRRFTDGYWPTPMPGYGFGPGPWLVRPGSPYWRYDPLWGMAPMPVVRDETVVRHELRVDLFDVRLEAPPGRKVWESRAAAYAPTESLPRLMPGLATAVFSEFPGESGATRRVDVPLPEAAR